MTVKEVMEKYTIIPEATGELVNDAWIFAIDTSEDKNADVDDYVVAEEHISSVNASYSADTSDSQYLRSGKSTTKTGTQVVFAISGDRYVGDAFQDFVLSHKMIYATGEDARIPFVRFNVINGKGIKGIGTVIVNSDSSGEAGTNSTIDVEIRKSGPNPEEFQYVPKTEGTEEVQVRTAKETTKVTKANTEKEVI